MNRFFIYMGAKTKELPLIKALVPTFSGRVFEPCIDLATSADWIFVDPPYWERQDYNGKGFSEDDHRRLAESLHRTEARWLLIHPDCDLYRELYMGYIIEEEDFRYNIHFGKRGTDRSHAQVKHLYIRNYQI